MKNDCVIRLGALGDVVLLSGVLDHLHREHSRTFTLITHLSFAPLFDGHPAVDRVEPFKPGPLSAWRARCRELSSAYAGGILYDLHANIRSRLLSLSWRGPVRRYRKMSLERRVYLLFRLGRLSRKLCALNVTQRYLEAFLPGHGQPAAALAPKLYLRNGESEKAKHLLSGHGINRPFVAFHPYATHASKAWPGRHWQTLAQTLAADGVPCVVLGRATIPLRISPAVDLTNATDIRSTMAVLSLAQGLVTNDSGPMHLGTAMGTPVVALFGPTAREWGFYPAGKADCVLRSDLSCSPCSLHGKAGCCRGLKCMESISPGKVVEALKGHRSPPTFPTSSC